MRPTGASFLFPLVVIACVAASYGQEADRLSSTSLRLTIRKGEIELGYATGFAVEKHGKYYLVTNRHVALLCSEDKNPEDVGGWLCADNLLVLQNKANHAGEWFKVREDPYDEHHTRRWLEHPTLGSSADLVALPLKNTNGIAFFPLDLELRKTQIQIPPGDSVSIVGFPFGIAQAGGLAVWKSGTTASDLGVDVGDKPRFLLDTTARPGMSGSPVYARRYGTYSSVPGLVEAGDATKFLGVYSAQNTSAEIGYVWKAKVVAALYDSLP